MIDIEYTPFILRTGVLNLDKLYLLILNKIHIKNHYFIPKRKRTLQAVRYID